MLLFDTRHMKLLILTIMNDKITTQHLCHLRNRMEFVSIYVMILKFLCNDYVIVLELYYSAITSHFG
jgi:hypothetical protein